MFFTIFQNLVKPKSFSIFKVLNILFRIICYFSISFLLYTLNFIENSPEEIFLYQSILTCIIVGIEISLKIKELGKIGILHPICISLILTFFLPYGISNYILFGESRFDYLPLISDQEFVAYYYLAKLMFWVNVAIICILLGHDLKGISNAFNGAFSNLLNLKKNLAFSNEINYPIFICFFIISTLLKVYLINSGQYGWASNSSVTEQNVNFSQVFHIISSVSSLQLLIVSLIFFKTKRYKNLFFIIICIEVLFSLASGMKGNVIRTFLLVFVAHFFIYNKPSKVLIALSLFSIIIAYVIIEPMRETFSERKNNDIIEFNDIINQINTETVTIEAPAEIVANTFEKVVSRLNLSQFGALSYKLYDVDRVNVDFHLREKFLLSPVFGFIPRAIWKDKPKQEAGKIFNEEILNRPTATSISPSLFGFIILDLGSFLYIIPIFIAFGILYRTIWTYPLYGIGGIILYLALINTLASIDDPANPFINFFRNSVLVIIALKLFLKKIKYR